MNMKMIIKKRMKNNKKKLTHLKINPKKLLEVSQVKSNQIIKNLFTYILIPGSRSTIRKLKISDESLNLENENQHSPKPNFSLTKELIQSI